MSPIQGYIGFDIIDIALTGYAIQYRPYGATRLQTNNPKGVALPNMVREGYEHENMNMPVQDAMYVPLPTMGCSSPVTAPPHTSAVKGNRCQFSASQQRN
jgi:hypothetical protein